MWTAEHTAPWPGASRSEIWRRWTDASLWAGQDAGVEWARNDGPTEVGSRIILKPKGAPRTTITVTAVEYETAFDTKGRLPLASLRIEHRMGAEEFTHRVIIDGPMSALWGRLLGRRMAAGLPAMMESIARHAAGEIPPR